MVFPMSIRGRSSGTPENTAARILSWPIRRARVGDDIGPAVPRRFGSGNSAMITVVSQRHCARSAVSAVYSNIRKLPMRSKSSAYRSLLGAAVGLTPMNSVADHAAWLRVIMGIALGK